MPQPAERMLGVQLWLNIPGKDKMRAEPFYHGVVNSEIQEFALEGGRLRLLAGDYEGHKGIQGKYLPLDYYDIFLDAHATVELAVPGSNKSAMVFTLEGDAVVSGTPVPAKTAARFGDGDTVTIEAGEEPIEILFMCSERLGEPIAWYGPIVMSTNNQLVEAITELKAGTFIKQAATYENESSGDGQLPLTHVGEWYGVVCPRVSREASPGYWQRFAEAHPEVHLALHFPLLCRASVPATGELPCCLFGDVLGHPRSVARTGHHDVPHAPVRLQAAVIALFVAQASAGISRAKEMLVVEEAPDAARGVQPSRSRLSRESRHRLLELRAYVWPQLLVENPAVVLCAGVKVGIAHICPNRSALRLA